MTPPVVLHDRLQDERNPHDYTFMGRKTVVLGFGFDAEAALSKTDIMKIINACKIADASEAVGCTAEIVTHGEQMKDITPDGVSSPAWFAAQPEIPLDDPSDEEEGLL